MKYIRTTYGIYNSKDVYSPDNPKPRYIFKKDIIAQADTIEELCDEFVIDIVSNETQKPQHYIFDSLAVCKGMTIKEGWKGAKYGAIWTGKGLIYVAKMNDKGELKLL